MTPATAGPRETDGDRPAAADEPAGQLRDLVALVEAIDWRDVPCVSVYEAAAITARINEARTALEGERWVDAREERLKAPVSRRETQQMAREAVDEAESAKESVRNYRKKLSRVKSDADDLKEQGRWVTGLAEENTDHLDEVESMIWEDREDIRDLRNSKVDVKDSRERIRSAKQDLREENRELRETIRTLDDTVQESIEALREENTALRERLDTIEEELGKSWTAKIRGQ